MHLLLEARLPLAGDYLVRNHLHLPLVQRLHRELAVVYLVRLNLLNRPVSLAKTRHLSRAALNQDSPILSRVDFLVNNQRHRHNLVRTSLERNPNLRLTIHCSRKRQHLPVRRPHHSVKQTRRLQNLPLTCLAPNPPLPHNLQVFLAPSQSLQPDYLELLPRSLHPVFSAPPRQLKLAKLKTRHSQAPSQPKGKRCPRIS